MGNLGVDGGQETCELFYKVLPFFFGLSVDEFCEAVARINFSTWECELEENLPWSLNLEVGVSESKSSRMRTHHWRSLQTGSLSLVRNSNVFCEIWPGGTVQIVTTSVVKLEEDYDAPWPVLGA